MKNLIKGRSIDPLWWVVLAFSALTLVLWIVQWLRILPAK